MNTASPVRGARMRGDANTAPVTGGRAAAGTAFGARAGYAGMGLAALVLGAWVASQHGLSPPLAALAGMAAVAGSAAHGFGWLLWLPALVPVADQTRHTGQFLATESDLLMLAVIAGASLRAAWRGSLPPGRSPLALRPAAVLLPGLYLLATGVAAWRGLGTSTGLDPAALGYGEGLNALRLFKPVLLAALLAPLAARAFREGGERAGEALATGLVCSLLGVAVVSAVERVQFTGLLDMATDYRITGPFWEMHVGGAALDGWLLATLPFAMWQALQARRPLLRMLALAASALGIYVTMVTFTRSTQAGFLLQALWLAGAALRGVPGSGNGGLRRGVWAVLVGAALLLGCGLAFAAGGYRAVLAWLLLCGAVYAGAPRLAGSGPLATAGLTALAVPLAAVAVLGAGLFPKGPYVLFAGVLAGLGLALAWAPGRPLLRAAALMLSAAAAVAAVGVAVGWAGPSALPGMGVAVLLPLIAVLAGALSPAPLWQASRAGGVRLLVPVMVVVPLVFTLGGHRMVERMGQVGGDMSGRLAHWHEALRLADGTAGLGIGAGRFPEAWLWAAPLAQRPGVATLEARGDARTLVLVAPGHVLGWGELHRVLQWLPADTAGTLTVEVMARAPGGPVGLHVELCRRHLIYASECPVKVVELAPSPDFKPVVLRLEPPAAAGWPPRPLALGLAATTQARRLEVASVSVRGADGRELIANGDFAAGGARWFISSDKIHLPWHAKNLWLHHYVEQGVFGLFAVSALWLAALLRVSVGRARRHALAPPLAAALIGFAVVGAFDSVLDAPRLLWLFLLLAGLALSLRPPGGRASG